MRKILTSLFLLLFILVGSAWAPTPKFGVAGQEVDIKSLAQKIISHPSLELNNTGVYFIREKENLKALDFWRWNMHDISVTKVDGEPAKVVLEVRKYQNTGNSPESALAVYYTIIDYDLDGVADKYYREIRMLIMEEPFDGQTLSMGACPDDICQYNFKDIQEVYNDELKFWQNKLQ